MVGLHCDCDPAWSRVVLERTSPMLEALELVSPGPEHLLVVRDMPCIRSLHLRGEAVPAAALPLGLQELRIAHVTREQLMQVPR